MERPYPGAGLVPNGTRGATMAVTIDAAPHEVALAPPGVAALELDPFLGLHGLNLSGLPYSPGSVTFSRALSDPNPSPD